MFFISVRFCVVQVEQNAIDFVYTNPSIYSCLESEFQLTSLATLRNLALGKEVNVFGGVIFSKAGQGQLCWVTSSLFIKPCDAGSGIKNLDDIRGRRVALSSLAALGAGICPRILRFTQRMDFRSNCNHLPCRANAMASSFRKRHRNDDRPLSGNHARSSSAPADCGPAQPLRQPPIQVAEQGANFPRA